MTALTAQLLYSSNTVYACGIMYTTVVLGIMGDAHS